MWHQIRDFILRLALQHPSQKILGTQIWKWLMLTHYRSLLKRSSKNDIFSKQVGTSQLCKWQKHIICTVNCWHLYGVDTRYHLSWQLLIAICIFKAHNKISLSSIFLNLFSTLTLMSLSLTWSIVQGFPTFSMSHTEDGQFVLGPSWSPWGMRSTSPHTWNHCGTPA